MTNLKVGLIPLAAKPYPAPEGTVAPPATVVAGLADQLYRNQVPVRVYAGMESDFGPVPVISGNLSSPWHDYGPENEHPISYTERRAEYDLILSRLAMNDYRKKEINLLHSHDFRLNPYLFAEAGIPLLYTPHFDIESRLDPYDYFRIEVLKQMKVGFIHISKKNYTTSKRLGLPTLGYVPNGIDTTSYMIGDAQRRGVLVVAIMSPHKMIKESIEAAQLAGETITLIGPAGSKDEDQLYFKELLADYFQRSHVRYLGPLTREKVIPYYQQAKVLLYPSQSEGMPLTILEAMACGLPVVGSGIESIAEIITSGQDGCLLEDNKPESMATAIALAQKIAPEVCRRTVEEHFSLETMYQGYSQLYQKFMATFS